MVQCRRTTWKVRKGLVWKMRDNPMWKVRKAPMWKQFCVEGGDSSYMEGEEGSSGD